MSMTDDELRDLVERLRTTTRQMASSCSVNMALWNEHSNAALEAADALTAAQAEIAELRAALAEAGDALEPFAKHSERYIGAYQCEMERGSPDPSDWITAGLEEVGEKLCSAELHAAAAALAAIKALAS